jgi:hypothetical protein
MVTADDTWITVRLKCAPGFFPPVTRGQRNGIPCQQRCRLQNDIVAAGRMDKQQQRLAAAAYDRGLDERRPMDDRVHFVSVELGEGRRRALLCDVRLPGDPPLPLLAAIADTFSLLRVAWVELLKQEIADERRRLNTVHAALQQEIVTTEWSWTTRLADAATLARTLTGRRERYRATLAMPKPHGLGLLLPRQARATEDLPDMLAQARVSLVRTLGVLEMLSDRRTDGNALLDRAAWLRSTAYEAIGAWRLGQFEASQSAAAVAMAASRALDGLEKVDGERLDESGELPSYPSYRAMRAAG